MSKLLKVNPEQFYNEMMEWEYDGTNSETPFQSRVYSTIKTLSNPNLTIRRQPGDITVEAYTAYTVKMGRLKNTPSQIARSIKRLNKAIKKRNGYLHFNA